MKLTPILIPLSFGLATICLVQPAWAASEVEFKQIATNITVKIEQEKTTGVGSGVLIKKIGNVYTVITADHVLGRSSSQFRIITPDGKIHNTIPKSTKSFKPNSYDLATVEFTSSNNYQLAKTGDSDKMIIGTPIYTAGFPAAISGKKYLAPGGNASIGKFNFPPQGKILAHAKSRRKDGYQLAYSSNTLPGMSGGAVLNNNGELVAVHTGGSATQQKRVANSEGKEASILFKSNRNWGIPISTYSVLAKGKQPKYNLSNSNQSPDDLYIQAAEKSNDGEKNNELEAIKEFDRLILLKKDYAATHAGRAEAQGLIGENLKAVKDYTTAIKLDLNNAFYHASRGYAYLNLKQYKNSIYDFDNTLVIQPNYAIAHNNRGVAYRRLKQYSKGLKDLTQAIRLDPDLAQAYYNRGNSYRDLKQYQEAIKDYTQAIKLKPDEAGAYYNRGNSYRDLKQYQEAIKDHTQAIRLDPDLAQAYNNRGNSYRDLKQYQKADQDVRKAAALFKQQGDESSYQRALELLKDIDNQKNK
jgi:tetratricopeptide (TPR) repeat protein